MRATRLRRCIWYAMTVALLFSYLVFRYYPAPLPEHREFNLDLLAYTVNPLITLVVSAKDHLREEPVPSSLDTSSWTRIDETNWQAPEATRTNRPSILLIAVESMRHDVIHLRHQGREVMPNTNALARRGLHCTRAYAQSTHSDYSDVCIVSSLYPLRKRRHHYYRICDPWPKTRIYDLLKPAGYATAIISSQNEGWGQMDRFLASPNLDLFYDAERSGAAHPVSTRDTGMALALKSGYLRAGNLDDNHTTDTAIQWMTKQTEENRPFFLAMNFQSSHFPYELSPGTEQPFQPCQLDFDASFLWYPKEKTPIVRNAYYNALHEIDRQIGRLMQALEYMGRLQDSIVAVYGENGEAFYENGTLTHAREPVEPAIHVGCVFHAPGRLPPRVEDYPMELVDLVPTIFGLVGWPVHPNFQGRDVLAADRPPLDKRLLFFHVENPLARCDAVLLGGRWKLFSNRQTKQQALYDIQSDPSESVNLLKRHPDLADSLRRTLDRWRQQQLAYYHYPHYYETYYPPRPPRSLVEK